VAVEAHRGKIMKYIYFLPQRPSSLEFTKTEFNESKLARQIAIHSLVCIPSEKADQATSSKSWPKREIEGDGFRA